MTYVLPLWPHPAVPVAGTDALFPVRRIFCVGQNYAAHAREMGVDSTRTPPCFFSKPAAALVRDGSVVPYPPATANLHYEIELVVALASGGAGIATERALECVYGYAAGIDLTRRDLQSAAKAAGQPWDMAKGFDASAPVGPITPVSIGGHPTRGGIRLAVNGAVKQDGDISAMIWNVADVIAHLSRLVTLAAGDLIFTGTPAGVGPVVAGDALEGTIEGVGAVSVTIA